MSIYNWASALAEESVVNQIKNSWDYVCVLDFPLGKNKEPEHFTYKKKKNYLTPIVFILNMPKTVNKFSYLVQVLFVLEVNYS